MNRGFTIIELLIYIGLFAVVIGGAMTASYSIAESSGRAETRAMMQEEGNFLINKMQWILSGVKAVTEPAVGDTGTTLSVVKWDPAEPSPLVVSAVGTELLLKRGAGTAAPLNSDSVAVSDFRVRHLFDGGTDPESVEVSFLLSAKTPTGGSVTQSFETTVYLRK